MDPIIMNFLATGGAIVISYFLGYLMGKYDWIGKGENN